MAKTRLKTRFGKHFRYTNRRPPVLFPADFWSEDTQPIVTFLRTFHTLHRDTPIARQDALTLLDGLDTRPLTAEHVGAQLLGRSLLVILATIHTRARQKHRAFGGKLKPLEFDLAELEQTLPDARTLPTTLQPLCDLLVKDLWVLLRLVWAGQDLYTRKSALWVTLHRLVGIVLLRILMIWKQIQRFNPPWIAIGCLRWALREVWGSLFGQPVKLNKAAKDHLKQEALSIGQERELWKRLKEESDTGAGMPGPFVPLVERWLSGDTPPPYKPQTDEEREANARFWL